MHESGEAISRSAGPSRRAAPWMRPLLGALSPAGSRGRLTILIFHRVHARPDPLFPNEMHAAGFAGRMECVRHWFNVLPLDEAIAALDRGSIPARALAITFDDGYADNATVALPILRRLGLPATFFVATRFLDGGRMWNDTVIEAVRAAAGSELDLSTHGWGKHAIESPQQRKAAIGAILTRLKYLPQEERQSSVDAIAAQTGVAVPGDLMMTGDQVRSLAAAGMGYRWPHGQPSDSRRARRCCGAARDQRRTRSARRHRAATGQIVRLSERQTQCRLPCRARSHDQGAGIRRGRFDGGRRRPNG